MKITTYQSKRIGTVIVKTQGNQATISSKRLELKSLNQCDTSYLTEQYKRLLINPENTKWFGTGNIWSEQEVKDLILEEKKYWHEGRNFGAFTVYDAKAKNFIGSLFINQATNDFAHIGTGHKQAIEIGYIIDPDFNGQGYGTEIAILGKKYIKYLAENLANLNEEKRIKEIVATVHPLNKGSLRILEKTLKHQEPEEFKKFGGQPRLLFFKPLKAEKSANIDFICNAKL
ncbi:acetyltransferase [Legionella busanensis]|uniref:Acetyltransferase n=1 Tax=Legionella busanensis TaxID=190655 RepID=A0A378JWN4_9GAMM|nr:GNAT family N-acetyltransferase [Legionella busanensis]STX52632.1 acetyltransferase [Legionella busanensis]